MNVEHKINKLRNRLNRLKKRLTDTSLPSEQKNRVNQRLAELESQFGEKVKFPV